MSFVVKGFYHNNSLALTIETAKEAFSKAVEWHIVEQLADITISDGVRSYRIVEFAQTMALNDIGRIAESQE